MNRFRISTSGMIIRKKQRIKGIANKTTCKSHNSHPFEREYKSENLSIVGNVGCMVVLIPLFLMILTSLIQRIFENYYRMNDIPMSITFIAIGCVIIAQGILITKKKQKKRDRQIQKQIEIAQRTHSEPSKNV